MKMFNFPYDTTIFLLRDINCHARIQSIFTIIWKASSTKINLSKIQAFWAGTYKNRTDKQGQIIWSELSIKILGLHFVNPVLGNNNWDIMLNHAHQ